MNHLAASTLHTFAQNAALAGQQLLAQGFTEWGRHLLRDAELAAKRGNREIANEKPDGEMQDVPQFIDEANQADTNRPCIDYTELQWIEAVLDGLETAHADLSLLGHHTPTLISCGCEYTASVRKARSVTSRVRSALGLRQRLEDRV